MHSLLFLKSNLNQKILVLHVLCAYCLTTIFANSLTILTHHDHNHSWSHQKSLPNDEEKIEDLTVNKVIWITRVNLHVNSIDTVEKMK